MKLDYLMGRMGHASSVVEQENTSLGVGTGTLPIFATPQMLILMEQAAINALQNQLPLGTTSVCTKVQIEHVSATPLGHHIQAEARITEVHGRRIEFEINAFDEKGKIGTGTQERFIVEVERFMKKVQSKAPAS